MRGSYGLKVVFLFLVNIAFYVQNLLFLPLISRTLGVEMYGVWSQISAAMNLLSTLVLLGLPNAFTRFSAGEESGEQVARNYYTILLFITATGIVVSMLLYGSSGIMSRIFIRTDREVVGPVQVSCLLLLAQVLSRYSITYFSALQRTPAYSFLRLCQPSMIICTAALMLTFGFGLVEMILSFAGVHLLVFAASQYLVLREIGVRLPDLKLLKPFLLFSLPLLPSEMMNWVIGLSDRYVIGSLLPVVEVGNYSAGYALGMVVMFFYAPFRAFMYPKATELWEKGDEYTLRKVLNYSNKYPLLMSIPAVFGFLALQDPILRSVTGKSLQVSMLLIPMIAVGYVFHYVGTAYAAVFQFEKKTKYITYGYCLGAIVNVVGNIYLVPHLGIMGAAGMTMVTFLLVMSYFIRTSTRFFDIELEWVFVWKSVVSAFIMYGVLILVGPALQQLSNIAYVICSIAIGVLSYLLVIFWLGVVSREEIDYFRNLLRVGRDQRA